MDAIARPDIKKRIERDNPWWSNPAATIVEASYDPRVYLPFFKALAAYLEVQRAAVLFGPRRVGKTVIIKQFISELISQRINPKSILVCKH